MMTLTPQLGKIAIKRRASCPTSNREPDVDFQKLVDKLEQAEITVKLEETEHLKLQYVNNIQKTTSQINNIHDSDKELAEKFTLTKRIQITEVSHHSKNGVITVVDVDIALLNAEKNNRIIKANHNNIEN